jgi:hypothetical protein
MRLITLLNHCQHFSGFVYVKARLLASSQTIEIDVRPRRGSNPVCSGCHKRAPAYDLRPASGYGRPWWWRTLACDSNCWCYGADGLGLEFATPTGASGCWRAVGSPTGEGPC